MIKGIPEALCGKLRVERDTRMQFSSMIKTSVIILVIAIVIAGIAQIPRILNVRTVHYWNAEKKFEAARDRQLTPYEVDELMRGVGYRDFWRPVLDNVIIHGNEPAVREQLHDMVNGGYPETAFTPRALFALFRPVSYTHLTLPTN